MTKTTSIDRRKQGKRSKLKGTRNELKSVRYLEKQGYSVTKAGGSLGVWDLIAIGCNDMILIQVKSNRPPGKDEMTRLHGFVFRCKFTKPCLKKHLHIWNDYARSPVITEIPFP